MASLSRKTAEKAVGLPPGTLVFVGEKRVEEVRITVIDYDETRFEEKEVKAVEECYPFKDKPTLTWVNVDGLHQVEVLEKLGESIESLEEEVVSKPTPQTLQEIHRLKREMIFLRKSVWPLRESISPLQRTESGLISEPTDIYLRDVYDHTIQVIDSVESFRDMVSGMLDIYLSSVSNRMNEVMKVLTIIATIFIPTTFVAGIYGMNFKYMPELEWPGGYFAALAVMAIIGVSMLVYFRRQKWL